MLYNDEYYMNLALVEAKKAFKKGDVPVGAVIVSNITHEVISCAHNLREINNDISAHAEILAIKKAEKKIENWRLEDTTIYVTLEPCLMCAGAIIQSRISHLVFAAFEDKTGAFGSIIDVTKIYKNSLTITHGVCEKESKKLLKEFFNNKRI